MKKEKGNLTLKQLEKRKRLAMLLGIIISAIVIIVVLIGIKTNIIIESEYSAIIITLIIILPLFFGEIVGMECDKQIELKERQIKVKTIKSLAQKGNLKESVVIREREIIEYILFVGIERIEIESVKYQGTGIVSKSAGFQANIYLKNGKCLKPISLSDKKVIELLNPDLEKYILNLLITDINLIEEPEGDTEVTITGNNNCTYYQDYFEDDDLLKIFELKEE